MEQSWWEEQRRLLTSLPDFRSKAFFNARYASWKCKEVLDQLVIESNEMRLWCDAYLEEHRQLLFVKYWTEHGWSLLNRFNEGTGNVRFLPSLQEVCPRFQEDVPELYKEFQDAYDAIVEVNAKQDIKFCDIKEILSIHEGKPCRYNDWYCWDCEDMEEKWHSSLLSTLRAKQNVFLNKYVKEEFVKEKTEAKVAPPDWKPPSQNLLLHRETYCTQSKTSAEVMYFIVKCTEWRLDLFSYQKKSSFEKFIHTWNFIEQFEPLIQELEGACEAVKLTT